VKLVALDSEGGYFFVRHLDALGYLAGSISARTFSPLRVVVAAIRFTIA
jgi:hypothetical protein